MKKLIAIGVVVFFFCLSTFSINSYYNRWYTYAIVKKESEEIESIIISDHKTHFEYITLFGKQIGKIPRA